MPIYLQETIIHICQRYLAPAIERAKPSPITFNILNLFCMNYQVIPQSIIVAGDIQSKNDMNDETFFIYC